MDPTFQAHLTIQPAHQEYRPGDKCSNITKDIQQTMILNATLQVFVTRHNYNVHIKQSFVCKCNIQSHHT